MVNEKEIVLDVGAGLGESFLRKAQENPEKRFVVIEPDAQNIPKGKLPKNLAWITGKVDEENALPLKEASVDEVNLDFVFIFLHGEEEENVFSKKSGRILSESLRVVKKNGAVFIREPRYMVDLLKPLLEERKCHYTVQPMDLTEALTYSESAREMAQDFRAGDQLMEPVVFKIQTTKK